MKSFVTHTSAKYATTYYVRDPQGNVLAVYERKRGETGQGTLTLTEQHLYGAGRIGMRKRNLALGGGAEEPVAPSTHYALTNHLGNVLAVISDAPGGGTQPTVESLTDYYPFGMAMPGRSYNAYRYGFNSQENVPELGEGHTTALYWEYDGRLGRRWNVDPKTSFEISCYSTFQLNPVFYTDVMGDTSDISTSKGEYLFSLDDGRSEKTNMTVKQLYANGTQWFEPLADNYQKIIKVSKSISTSESLLHFTWKDVADFSEKDRWMISYRQKGEGDWKYTEAHGYYLITIDGYPYWPDAIGQIPFAVDYYTDVRLKFKNNEDAIINTIQTGIQYGEGKILCGEPDFSNTYDNYFIIRGAYWASKRYKEEGDELKKNNNVKPEELQWTITNYGASLLKKASETYGK